MRPDQLRREFPVFEEVAYLNAGTFGPLPSAALRAAADSGLAAAEAGRVLAYFQKRQELAGVVRERYARAIGAQPQDVALTTATSDGIVRVLAAFGLREGDEVLTAPDEHPGLLGPLAQARRQLGVTVRLAPFETLHEAVGPDTRLIACSHVSWVTGRLAPRELSELDVPVLLDGAQGAGAVDVDVESLGCMAYAAAGQKWLCGPMGTGLLWISPQWRERLDPPGTTYMNLQTPGEGLDATPWPDARAFDAPALSSEALAAADAATGTLEQLGFDAVFATAAALADQLVERLQQAGRTVAPRDATTLVSFEDPEPEETVGRLREAGVVVRFLPQTPYVRASVGAWNDASDLDRLLDGLAA